VIRTEAGWCTDGRVCNRAFRHDSYFITSVNSASISPHQLAAHKPQDAVFFLVSATRSANHHQFLRLWRRRSIHINRAKQGTLGVDRRHNLGSVSYLVAFWTSGAAPSNTDARFGSISGITRICNRGFRVKMCGKRRPVAAWDGFGGQSRWPSTLPTSGVSEEIRSSQRKIVPRASLFYFDPAPSANRLSVRKWDGNRALSSTVWNQQLATLQCRRRRKSPSA